MVNNESTFTVAFVPPLRSWANSGDPWPNGCWTARVVIWHGDECVEGVGRAETVETALARAVDDIVRTANRDNGWIEVQR